MTLEEIDRSLADWKSRLEQAAADLAALTLLVPYQRLRGEQGWPAPQLSGATAERVQPALEKLIDFRGLHAELSESLQRVSRLRSDRKALDEIEAVLVGRSTEHRFQAMTDAFESARDAVLSVGEEWARWASVTADLEAAIAELSRRADALGVSSLPELMAVRDRFAALPGQIDRDPLGADATAAEVERALKKVRERLDTLARGHDQAWAELANAEQLLRDLEVAHRQARQARDDRMLKIAGIISESPAPVEDPQIAALGPWLAKIGQTLESGREKAARIGLEKWTGVAAQYLDQDKAARVADELLLRERLDLRGLLGALKAKAQANGRAEDRKLVALSEEAWQLLHRRPTPLPRARQLVTEYEARLI